MLNDDCADWREAWALFPGDIAYVWHGALHGKTVAENLETSGFAIRSQIVWAKEHLVFSVLKGTDRTSYRQKSMVPAGTMRCFVVDYIVCGAYAKSIR